MDHSLLLSIKIGTIFPSYPGGILPYLLTRSWKFAVENKRYIMVKERMAAVVDTTQGVLSARGMVQTGDVSIVRIMIPLHYETSFAFLPSPEIIKTR